MMIILMGIGGMSIAAWFYVRFPNVAPDDFRVGVLHIASAMLVGKLLVPTAASFTGNGSQAQVLLTVFGIAFPALVYLFLVGLWFLRLVQRSLSMGR